MQRSVYHLKIIISLEIMCCCRSTLECYHYSMERESGKGWDVSEYYLLYNVGVCVCVWCVRLNPLMRLTINLLRVCTLYTLCTFHTPSPFHYTLLKTTLLLRLLAVDALFTQKCTISCFNHTFYSLLNGMCCCKWHNDTNK